MGRTLATPTPPAVLAAVGLVLVAAVGLGACVGTPRSAGPSRTSDRTAMDRSPGSERPATAAAPDDPAPAPLAWSPCGTDLQCATLTVPLDYTHPHGPMLGLAVIRRPATRADQRIGALVVNPGGPGASGVTLVRDGFGQANGFGQRFDIVSWDPRGVGLSHPLACGRSTAAFQHLDPDPGRAAGLAALDQAARALANDCTDHAGPLLDHLDSDTTARDLDQLRGALGEATLTYAGFSYGTAIGLAYAQRYPTHLRALLLDGVVESDWDLEQFLSVQTSALDQTLQSIFDACTADAHCPVRDPGATYDQLAARLAAQPLTASGNPVGPAELATAAIETTYDPTALAPAFLTALARASAGQGQDLADLAARYRRAVPDFVTYLGVLCVDLPHPSGAGAYQQLAQTLESRSPRLGGAVANELLPCAFWSAPVARTPETVRAAGSPTILVVGNTGDAATPLSSAIWVARHLEHAVLLTYDGQGHTSVVVATASTPPSGAT